MDLRVILLKPKSEHAFPYSKPPLGSWLHRELPWLQYPLPWDAIPHCPLIHQLLTSLCAVLKHPPHIPDLEFCSFPNFSYLMSFLPLCLSNVPFSQKSSLAIYTRQNSSILPLSFSLYFFAEHTTTWQSISLFACPPLPQVGWEHCVARSLIACGYSPSP